MINIPNKMIQDPAWTKLMRNLPGLDPVNGPWVAGGSARRLYEGKDWSSGDIDIFFANDQQRRAWQEDFESAIAPPPEPSFLETISEKVTLALDTLVCKNPAPPKKKSSFWGYRTHNTGNADTYQIVMDNNHERLYKIQVIKTRYASSIMDLWSDFDFTISCFAADKNWVYWLPQAATDVAENVLRDYSSENKRNRALRIFKHYTYGFRVSPAMLLEAAELIKNGDFECTQEY